MGKELLQSTNCEHLEKVTFVPHRVSLTSSGRFRRALDPHPDHKGPENNRSILRAIFKL